MIKIFLGLFFIAALVHADLNENSCDINLKNIIVFYHEADKMYELKRDEDAVYYFEISIESAYQALNNCSHDLYNDSIYDYITSSELKISEINDNMNFD